MTARTKTILEIMKININRGNPDLVVFIPLLYIIQGDMRKSETWYRGDQEGGCELRVV